MKVGLRIDVDTHEGYVEGVPRLLEILDRLGIKATFYVAMGPDESGKAVFSAALKKGFIGKMLRTKAVSTYGLRTVLSGTLLPARPVGSSRPDLLRQIFKAGHELGPHSWNHRRWQDGLDRLPERIIRADLDNAVKAFRMATGSNPVTTAAPAWITNTSALRYEETLGFAFASDCRGYCPFYPLIGYEKSPLLQVPVTLPTLDEMLGGTCETANEFYKHIMGILAEALINEKNGISHVFTVHAETEGRAQSEDFEKFLLETSAKYTWVPLARIAGQCYADAPICRIKRAPVSGRHGTVSMQQVV